MQSARLFGNSTGQTAISSKRVMKKYTGMGKGGKKERIAIDYIEIFKTINQLQCMDLISILIPKIWRGKKRVIKQSGKLNNEWTFNVIEELVSFKVESRCCVHVFKINLYFGEYLWMKWSLCQNNEWASIKVGNGINLCYSKNNPLASRIHII